MRETGGDRRIAEEEREEGREGDSYVGEEEEDGGQRGGGEVGGEKKKGTRRGEEGMSDFFPPRPSHKQEW